MAGPLEAYRTPSLQAYRTPSLPRLVPTAPSLPRGLQVLGAKRGGTILPKQD